MKKQKIQLIVLAIVLVALLAAYFIIPKVVKDEEEETENYIVEVGGTIPQSICLKSAKRQPFAVPGECPWRERQRPSPTAAHAYALLHLPLAAQSNAAPFRQGGL